MRANGESVARGVASIQDSPSRPLEGETAAGHLRGSAGARDDALSEFPARRLRLRQELAQLLHAGLRHTGPQAQGGSENENQGLASMQDDHSRLGWMISRLPLLSIGVTSPAFSMSSSRRAARL